jgi:hypothetical protein
VVSSPRTAWFWISAPMRLFCALYLVPVRAQSTYPSSPPASVQQVQSH